MAAGETIDQLKARLERLRSDSLDVVANASRIVFEGVQKLAEQELEALNGYYKSALSSAKSATGPGDLASQQLDLLQDAVHKAIAAARESLGIIARTRAELVRLVGSTDGTLDGKALTKITAPAHKAIEDVRKLAATAQAAAANTAQDLKKTVEKELAQAEKKGKAMVEETSAQARKATAVVRTRIGSVLDIAAPPAAAKKAVTARPSPESRAARAAGKSPRKAAPPAARSTPPPRKR